MRELLEKIKKIDTKVLTGIGVLIAVVVIVLIFAIISGSLSDSEKGDSDSQKVTESEKLDEFDQSETSEIEEITEESEIHEAETQENQQVETEDSETEIIESEKPETQKPETQKPETQKPESSEPVEESEEIVETPVPPQTEQTPPPTEETEKNEIPIVLTEHTVNVVSAGGHKLYNVKVHAYVDESMTELFTTAATNSKGVATLELEQGKDYFISLTNVPEGYKLSPSYSLSEKETSIVLESEVVTGKDYPSKKLKVGNVMYDFTVPSASGEEIKLSEIIKEKELVLLNFWYVNCQFCVMEFPYMSNAYNAYKDRVEIVALNPFDDMASVNAFLVENPLPFKVATCDASIPNLFGIDAYPVTVVIDKYGVIRQIEKGAILKESGFVNLFNKYL